MQLVVTTASGSKYIFNEVNGEIRVSRNLVQEGIVQGAVNIEMGKPLTINAYMLNPYNYAREEEVSFLRSTPVVSVSISGERGA